MLLMFNAILLLDAFSFLTFRWTKLCDAHLGFFAFSSVNISVTTLVNSKKQPLMCQRLVHCAALKNPSTQRKVTTCRRRDNGSSPSLTFYSHVAVLFLYLFVSLVNPIISIKNKHPSSCLLHSVLLSHRRTSDVSMLDFCPTFCSRFEL